MAHLVYIITKLELGGAQKVCLSLLKHAEQNTDGASLISGPEGVLAHDAKKFSSVFLLPSMQREIKASALFQDIKTFFAIAHVLRSLKKKHGSIIVHTHSTKAGILGRWASLFAGIKHRVHTIHGYGFHAQQSWPIWLLVWSIEYITLLITSHTVCVSENDRVTGIRLFHNFKQKSSVINAAVEWPTSEFTQNPSRRPLRQTQGPPQGERELDGARGEEKLLELRLEPPKHKLHNNFTIGTVACFKPQKNLIDLLSAFHRVIQATKQRNLPTPHLMIIGDGVQRSTIEAWIKEQALTNHITLLGWQHNVYAWMRQWQMFALSSLWEGLPCAVVEARLCKLPVVAYDVGGIREVVFDNKNGFLIPQGNWNMLAEKMLRIITTPTLHTTLSNYPDSLTAFDIQCMVEKHHKLYADLLNKSSF